MRHEAATIVQVRIINVILFECPSKPEVRAPKRERDPVRVFWDRAAPVRPSAEFTAMGKRLLSVICANLAYNARDFPRVPEIFTQNRSQAEAYVHNRNAS